MKKLLSVTLILLIIVGMLSACAGKNEYIIMTDTSYEPFCYVDSKGKNKGFDIELINKIAKSENLNIKVVGTSLLDAFEAVDEDEADGVLAALVPTDELKEKYDFSDAYYGDFALAVKRNKNKKLIDSFNKGLKKLKENGKYISLIEKYFPGENK